MIRMDHYLSNPEIPMGLGMALAQNVTAMERFAAMSEQEQQHVVSLTHSIESKSEMREFVNQIAHGNYPTV